MRFHGIRIHRISIHRACKFKKSFFILVKGYTFCKCNIAHVCFLHLYCVDISEYLKIIACKEEQEYLSDWKRILRDKLHYSNN